MKRYSCAASEQQTNKHLYTLDTEAFSVEANPIQREGYQASAEIAVLGALTLARVHSTSAVVHRRDETCSDPAFRHFSFVLATAGEVTISHHLGMSTLGCNEFTLLDNSHPRTMFVHEHVTLLLINVPRKVLQRYIPIPEEVEGQVLTQGQGTQELFTPILALWEHMTRGSLREFAPAISDDLLGSVARAYRRYWGHRGSRTARRVIEVRQFIEAQLGNPELSVEGIAADLGVSSRYLRSLFHSSEKLSHYILRRRLEESASLLANPLYQSASITTIAFRCGFNSTAHFSRAFRKQYSLTPREYRRRHLEQNGL